MYLLYTFCFLPAIIGYILSRYNKQINIKEWLISSGCAFLMALPIHYFSYNSQVGDYETWSGKIVAAKHYPAWQEYYEYAVYRTEYYTDSETYTDSNGRIRTRTVTKSRQVFDHWEPTSRWHAEHWTAWSNINSSYEINKQHYLHLVKNFGNETAESGTRFTGEHASHMISGDPFDYASYLHNGTFIEPVTVVKWYENRIKAAPSIFNFIKVPNTAPVHTYPENKNPWKSDRVLGIANNSISVRKWDEMCARLGPVKRLNPIIIGFKESDSYNAELQRSKWIGGKKNDLVICYGPKWAKVFGWSESDICKRNIETLLLKNPINDNIIPLIEEEIMKNYTKREFTEDFAYLTVEPTTGNWICFILLLIVTQSGLYWWFYHNEI